MRLARASKSQTYGFCVRFFTLMCWMVACLICGPGTALGQTEEAEQPVSAEASESSETSQAVGRTLEAVPLPESKAAPAGLPKDSKSWDLPSDDTSQWDWVLTTSGEWIKGSIDRMRDGDLEFDSDEFDQQALEVHDIAAFYANRAHTYLFTDGSTVSGRGVLRGQELVIDGQTFKREQLMGIIKGKEEERNYWSGQLNLGLTLLLGNTEQATFTSSGHIRRESAKSRLSLEHNLTFGSMEGEVNVQNITGTAQFDIFLSKRWYITPAWLVTTHDRFQNIDVRAIPGAGAGVHFFQTPTFDWDFEVGLGYQYEKFREVVPGEAQEGHDGIVKVATWMDVDFGSMVDMELLWWTIFNYTAWGRTSHHGSLVFEFEITDIFDLTISAIYDRVEQPESYEVEDDTTVPPTTEVVTPKSDDLQLVVGLMVEF